MPLEIKELHIKAVVDNGSRSQSSPVSASEADIKAIVAECVHQVMEILKDKADR